MGRLPLNDAATRLLSHARRVIHWDAATWQHVLDHADEIARRHHGTTIFAGNLGEAIVFELRSESVLRDGLGG